MWDSYLIWLNKYKIIIYDKIQYQVFQVGVLGKIWAKYLNIFEKVYKKEAKHR